MNYKSYRGDKNPKNAILRYVIHTQARKSRRVLADDFSMYNEAVSRYWAHGELFPSVASTAQKSFYLSGNE